jgi:dihydrolipoamide dehydrogenase
MSPATGNGSTTVVVPDLGEVEEAVVIDVLVKVGDRIEIDTPLITLESEKASLDVPSTAAGIVQQVTVRKGDKVAKGAPILVVSSRAASDESAVATDTRGKVRASEPYGGEPYVDTVPISPMNGRTGAAAEARSAPPSASGERRAAPSGGTDDARKPAPASSYDYDVVVLGAGPGGYTAAFRAADLGLRVALVERDSTLGGVCLNVGCIPSKALLHMAKLIDDAAAVRTHGIDFGTPRIDAGRLREWKASVVAKLANGLTALAKQRKVDVITGQGRFADPHALEIGGSQGSKRVTFASCIIAAGSESMSLPNLPDDPRIIDSTGALELDLPSRLLVIGGGIIGLEMATVYAALGVKVGVVELTPGLMPGCDVDLVKPLQKRITGRYENIWLDTKVVGVEAGGTGLKVSFEGARAPSPQTYDRVLVAVGRTPNGKAIAADAAGVKVDARGFIAVDRQMRTNVPHIYAIGDIVGQPMLAHKATHEGKVAAEVAAGQKSYFDARVIPSVAYTDPEIAWVGLTETAAKAAGTPYEKAVFPWAASGRSLAMGRDEGFTKLLFDPDTHRVVGGGIVGPHAGDLISEVALAIEMGCDAADIGLTIHPHPTLSETVAMSAEAFEGTLTDLYLPKKKQR